MKKSRIYLLGYLLIALCLASCNVSLVPAKSPTAIALVQKAATATENLYSDIIGSTDKSFLSFSGTYTVINGEIQDVISFDSTRKKTGVVLIIARDIKNRFVKYAAEHQSYGSLNDDQAARYNDYMKAVFSSLLTAENNFK